jgi:hypothetical protein
MSHYYYHCVSSAKIHGGEPEDYVDVHKWMDRGRQSTSKLLHRALCHHTQGIADGVDKFGVTITNSNGKKVPVSLLLEQHIKEDLGFIPTLDHYLELMHCARWVSKPAKLLYSKLKPKEANS